MQKKEEGNAKLWGGRFKESASPIMERIGESVSFDKKLYKEDLEGSRAHAKMLHKIGILNAEELKQILEGLAQVESEIESGNFKYSSELEDIHMHIESRLTELKGEVGKKLHTARSRNDQVAQDTRLYVRNRILEIQERLESLRKALYTRASENVDTIIPGYTHLQVAQPVRASHFLLAYFWMFTRDTEFFEFAKENANLLVLGSGAMAGVNYQNDRDFLASELKTNGISPNSMDAVASRDHLLQFLFAATQTMLHASRFCEDIILYSSQEFGLVKLPDSLTTGSSIMPQKKNPDIAELIRGKSARVAGNLNHLIGLLKGLPLTYNRDLQEDKLAVFDAVETVLISLEGLEAMVSEMQFRPERGERSLKEGFATATDLADYLVGEKKIPFRTAHELVGRLVSECVERKENLFTIPEEIRTKISPHFSGKEYEKAVSLELSADKKASYGGTARSRQLEQLELARKSLESSSKN
ncbi:argininosuccinate lyase [Leptospira langatensis]|uniref:Argininosuccinate lyase n=1 Tax=Leptospira langatensis TaxID=2484983 RepID=A0A5F1ZXD1_9LEPT|nr:argininosuccinate lyase [Leptospira langatensis]TGJ98612.1 argininosuccinate lyase [Leptospira langatensis]TGL43525.1 argininosuccinate lyase [Leptospira langatensis]